ncbi:MAG: glycosyltransferase [Roseiflexus sp.]|nr:glycosyltransferase [Roseiflexus sp.]MCS7288997.1 glycosyltransferase [Roseiflexus sp.]MDW8147114.1 glycosyltransferase [Roseiflexaceae bacterium]MDW8231697.1 glycosyltransferase [Roseiflexaceae bacterium]
MDAPSISLVCTVRDESDNIAELIDSMLTQSMPPDEIVINDCQSRDATPQIIAGYIAAGAPIRLVRGGHNIPSGRNNAIRHARGAIIACTDAGLRLDPHWLERITAPIRQDSADVVGGFFRPAPRSLFELALGATNYREAEEIDPVRFLPFGKSCAFRREVWERAGGYPEWANHCEDVVFALALKRLGFRFAFVPDALVFFRPRSSLAAFARQYYYYARGDGVAGLWTLRHAIRYATYLVAAALLLTSRRHPWLLTLIATGVAAYVRAPLWRLQRRAPALDFASALRAMLLIPVIRLVGDVAKMVGYPVGVAQRLRSASLRREIAQYREGASLQQHNLPNQRHTSA